MEESKWNCIITSISDSLVDWYGVRSTSYRTRMVLLILGEASQGSKPSAWARTSSETRTIHRQMITSDGVVLPLKILYY